MRSPGPGSSNFPPGSFTGAGQIRTASTPFHFHDYAWASIVPLPDPGALVHVIAADADEAIEAAAVEFRTDVKKLIAVRRYEIAS
jgi:hypothetical protein